MYLSPSCVSPRPQFHSLEVDSTVEAHTVQSWSPVETHRLLSLHYPDRTQYHWLLTQTVLRIGPRMLQSHHTDSHLNSQFHLLKINNTTTTRVSSFFRHQAYLDECHILGCKKQKHGRSRDTLI